MLPDTPSVSQLSHVISQAAPAFLLGALAAFIAVLISRLKPDARTATDNECNILDEGWWSRLD